MTDRELLELAAKAAGIKYTIKDGVFVAHGNKNEPPIPWNPLEDDGDALQLACKLALVVYCDEVEAWCEWGELNEDLEYEHHAAAEPQYQGAQSVRRAIVRAAAEIGRAM